MSDFTDLPSEFLKCRTWGHNREEFTPIDLPRPAYGWRESVRCVRCTWERHRLIDRKGAIISTSYRYPKGYLQPKGSGQVRRDSLRVVLFEMMRAQLQESDAIAANFAASPRRARRRKPG